MIFETKKIVGDSKDKLGKHAFRIKIPDAEDDDDSAFKLACKLKHLHIEDLPEEESEDDAFTDSEDEELSYTQSPIPDDTKCKCSEHYFCWYYN